MTDIIMIICDCSHLRTRVLLIAHKPMTPCFPDFGFAILAEAYKLATY